MDVFNSENENRNTPPVRQVNTNRSQGMEAASLVLGIISISTCTCLYTGIICGALAVMFALLSRGGQLRLSPRANVGLWLGIAGIVATGALYVFAYVFAISQYGSLENLLRAYCDMYGIDFEAMYGDYF